MKKEINKRSEEREQEGEKDRGRERKEKGMNTMQL